VEVVVDEGGNVISAKAVSGHTLLRGVSEKAARRAKLDPLALCGRQVKGVLSYNFILESTY
jgi:protein TonB